VLKETVMNLKQLAFLPNDIDYKLGPPLRLKPAVQITPAPAFMVEHRGGVANPLAYEEPWREAEKAAGQDPIPLAQPRKPSFKIAIEPTPDEVFEAAWALRNAKGIEAARAVLQSFGYKKARDAPVAMRSALIQAFKDAMP
jgi:hypothetical protein